MAMKTTSTDRDFLAGYEAIGEFLGWTARQVKHRALTGQLPIFKMGRTPCATKSGLRAWLSEQMTSGAQKGGN